MKITQFTNPVLLVSLLFITNSASAASAGKDPNALAEPSAKEIETYMGAVKQQEVTNQLLKSPLFKDCSAASEGLSDEDAKKDSIRDCVAKKIDTELDDSQIKKLSEDFDLSSFDKKAAKSAKSIREYLNDRLGEALYGEDKDANGKLKALRDRTIVGHDLYYQLYMEQIGKNTLLMVSQYCLENFGFDRPDNLIEVKKDPNNSNRSKVYSLENVITENPGNKDKPYSVVSEADIQAKFDTTAVPVTDFWTEKTKIKEYKVCNLPTQSECTAKNPNEDTRSINIIEKLKEAEFLLAKKESKVLEDKYKFCAVDVVKNMCNIYKCNNVYDKTSSQTEFGICNKLGISLAGKSSAANEVNDGTGIKLKFSKNKGQVACNVMNRLKDYRKMLIATGNLKKKLLNDIKPLGQFGFSNTGAKGYIAKGKKSVDNLTSISSTQLVDNVDKLSGSETEAENLRSTCMDQDQNGKLVLKEDADTNEECEVLLAQINEQDFNKIQLETEAKSALFIKKVGEINAENTDELKKFLLENGLGEYISKWEGGVDENAAADSSGGQAPAKLTNEELITLIKQDYQAKRLSELDAIKAKFKKEVELNETEGTNNTADDIKFSKDSIAEQTIGNIELHKKRVETLFQYSNIVSSYLTITTKDKDKDGNTKGDIGNITGRSVEITDAKDPEDKKMLGYFSKGTEQTNDGGTLNYINVLDAVLGTTTSEEDSGN
jgi:hypothetical protein